MSDDAVRQRWPELVSVLTGAASDFGNDAAKELEECAGKELADKLRASFALDFPAAQAVVDACWSRLSEGDGWTLPCWREAYVLSNASASLSDAHGGDFAAALRKLDMASIMGAPLLLLQPFAAEYEALLLSQPAAASAEALPQPPPLPSTLPAGLPGVPEITQPLAQLRASDPEGRKRFKREFVNVDRPAHLIGVGAEWAAVERWRDLGFWLQRYAHRHVPLEVGAHDSTAWREEVLPFHEFVRRHMMTDTPPPRDTPLTIGYLAQHPLFEQPGFDDLRGDFSVPSLCPPSGVARVNVWCGSSGTVTPLHFDSYEGILAQVCGFKYVRFYEASQSPLLYRTTKPWSQQRRWAPSAEEPASEEEAEQGGGAAGAGSKKGALGTVSLVDVEAPDLGRFPLFKDAKYSEAILGPGDAVYIPSGCWHYVRALTRSVSLNFIW